MTSFNATIIDNANLYDSIGAMIYIFGVLVWYAIGFGLILIDDIDPQSDRIATKKNLCLYQTVTDLHEQQDRNDILVELKDKQRRLKLWQIYYGSSKTHPVTIQKDNEAVELIVKQLSELNVRRRLLRENLSQISLDQDDKNELCHVDSDDENVPKFLPINRSVSHGHFKDYFQ